MSSKSSVESRGRYLTEILESLRKPVGATPHTVLAEPQPGYHDSLMRVAALSDYLVTLNGCTAPILKEVYGVPEEKIVMPHHGAPDAPFVDPNFYSVWATWATWSSRAGSFMSR